MKKVDEKTVLDLITKLDGDLDTRTKAAADLEKLGLGALPTIQKVLQTGGMALEPTRRLENVLGKIRAMSDYVRAAEVLAGILPNLYPTATEDEKRNIQRLLTEVQNAGVYSLPASSGLTQVRAMEGKKLVETCVRSIQGILQSLPIPVPDSVYESLEQFLDAVQAINP